MIFILNLVAIQLRKLATRLDGQDVVQYIHYHHDITIFVSGNADPRFIGDQIRLHMNERGIDV